MRVTGERIVTRQGGFNASWQRHAACYALAERFLGPGPVADLGCGTGHAYDHLAPRPTVGVDIDHDSLVGQSRKTVAADIGRLPLASASFDSVVCVHAIEHLPDPRGLLAECARVLRAGSTGVFITPNRLTFGRPDEIIDPYHYVEYDPDELRELCRPFFTSVQMFGLFGSDRYMEFHRDERSKLERLLKLDPLRIRRLVPRRTRQFLYDWGLTRARRTDDGIASSITQDDFHLESDDLRQALDLLAVCRLQEVP